MNWAIILISAAVAFTFRTSVLVVSGGRALPPRTEAALAVLAPAVIGATLVSGLTSDQGEPSVSIIQLVACLAAFLIVTRTKNLVFGATAGLAITLGWAAITALT